MPNRLPAFVTPMLAKLGQAFDSPRHFYELKWDGIRALGIIEHNEVRLLSRRDNEMTAKYPEFSFLEAVPPGCMLDGEIVVLEDGVPSFQKVLQREQARSEPRIRGLTHQLPALYVVFDLLYENYGSVMDQTLLQRRDRLRSLVERIGDPRFVYSDGVEGAGLEMFAAACERGFEGVVAKRMDSRYLPGRRTDAWTKFKRGESIYCVVVGFVPKGQDDFKSLIVASDQDGTLTVVGRVASGIDDAVRARLNRLLRERHRATPVVETSMDGEWVDPGIFCTVSYVERTRDGMMRAPVFHDLLVEE